MTEKSARIIANVVVGAAAVGAAVVILRTPPLRRLVFGLARTALTVTIPAWLWGHVTQAWDASGRAVGSGRALGSDLDFSTGSLPKNRDLTPTEPSPLDFDPVEAPRS